MLGNALRHALSLHFGNAQYAGDRRGHQIAIGERSELDTPDAVRIPVEELRGDLQCETRLAATPGARECQQRAFA